MKKCLVTKHEHTTMTIMNLNNTTVDNTSVIFCVYLWSDLATGKAPATLTPDSGLRTPVTGLKQSFCEFGSWTQTARDRYLLGKPTHLNFNFCPCLYSFAHTFNTLFNIISIVYVLISSKHDIFIRKYKSNTF